MQCEATDARRFFAPACTRRGGFDGLDDHELLSDLGIARARAPER
jgi:hypothetical protein